MVSMATILRQRVAEAGAQLDLLVLANEPNGSIGVDLASGAFVRARHPMTAGRTLRPFSVASGELAPGDMFDASQPELAELTSALRPTARLSPKKADRWLRPLLHPPRPPLLGLTGNALPYWTLEGDRPSVSLVEPDEIGIARAPGGYVCRFIWQHTFHELVLRDRRLLAALQSAHVDRCGEHQVQRLLGHAPDRLLVALTPPIQGYCYKAVMAVLPRR